MTKNRDVFNITRDESGYNKELRAIPVVDSIVTKIIDEHIARAQMGKAKYNADLDRTDLSVVDYLQHAKEEAMDLALYLEKAIQMLKGNG